MPGVRARLARHVEDAPAGAPHLRVVGGDLDLDFLHRLDRGDDGGAVADVDDRDPVERVVVPAPRSTPEGEKRGVGLVLLPDELRVAGMGHPGGDGREEERVAPRRGQGLDRLLVEGAPDRGVRGLEGHPPAFDRDLLRESAHLEREVHGDELLGADADPLVLDRLEALLRCRDRVGSGLDLDERVLAGVVRGDGSALAVRLVEQRHVGAGHHSARFAYRAAQAAVIRLSEQGHGRRQHGPAHYEPVPPSRHSQPPLRCRAQNRPGHPQAPALGPEPTSKQRQSREQLRPFTSISPSGSSHFFAIYSTAVLNPSFRAQKAARPRGRGRGGRGRHAGLGRLLHAG